MGWSSAHRDHWLASELAAHVARYGQLLIGGDDWTDAIDTENASRRKTARTCGRIAAVGRAWPNLNGDGRLLCRGGHTIAPGTPDRRNAIRTHTQVVPLPPGLSPPVRAVRLTDWMCLVHEEGELSCRHLWEPLEQVRDLPGPVRQLAGWGGTLCLELASGDVTCRAGSLMLQLRSKLSHVPWVTMPVSTRQYTRRANHDRRERAAVHTDAL